MATEKTTLSPFLTPSNLARLLDKRGPALGFSSVQSALQILGRECPSEVDIQKVIGESRILSLLDDQMPEKEEWEERKEAGEEGSNEDDWRRRKRKWAEDAAAGGHQNYSDPNANLRGGEAAGWGAGVRSGAAPGFITAEQRLAAKMTTAEKLAAAAAAGTAGFRSASSHMEELKQKRLNCEADKERLAKKVRHDAMLAKAVAKEQEGDNGIVLRANKAAPKSTILVGAKSSKRPVGQGSLMSYFAPKLPAPKELKPKQKTATEIIKQKKGQSLKEQIEALPQPKWPMRPENDGVVLLSSSPVRVRTKRKERTPTPPSSPAFAEFCRAIEEEIVVDGVGVMGMGTGAGAGAELIEACPSAPASSVGAMVGQLATSPAGTTTATVVGVSPAPPTSQSAPTVIAKKRTLGIKRSMNGWQNRASARND